MKIKRSDLQEMSYQEFGELLDVVTEKIQKYTVNKKFCFQLIVPILRSGAFTGLHLASKLKITNILPAQYKYSYTPTVTIDKKFDFPPLLYTIPKKSNILIVDTNTVHKRIANKVINDIRELYPDAHLYFASASLDQSIKSIDNIKTIFYGVLSNEARLLSIKEADALGITNEIKIFPWENIEEEWIAINA
jgi:hypothetical protein